jgi:hypothetical protein
MLASFLALLLLTAGLSLMLGTIRAGATSAEGTFYRQAFHSPETGVPVRIDPSSFKGTDWVDMSGVLKPGTPLLANGALAGTAADTEAKYVVPFAVGIAEGNTDALLDAAPNGDVAAYTRGDVVQEHVEIALGRDLSANELTAFNASGRFTLLA